MRKAQILAVLVFSSYATLTWAQVTIEIQDDGAPANGVGVATVNGGERQTLGETNAAGVLGFDPAFLMGKIEGETIIRECPDYRQVVLVPIDEQWDCSNDEEATGEEDCPCRRGGAWLLDSGRIFVQLQAPPFYTNPVAIGGIAGGGALVTVIAVSGGEESTSTTPPPSPISTPDPAPTTPAIVGQGNWNSVFTVREDPFRHHGSVRLDQVDSLQSNDNGGSFQVTGPPPWIPMNGTFNGTTGEFSVTGMGPIAGFNGVVFIFEGTISGDRFEGYVKVGADNTLPQGPIVYNATGTR